ncbi:MAG: MFS transporter [Caldilineaceae bacterium]
MQNNSIDATADRETHSPIDYSRKWYVMFAVGIALSLETIDTGIVNLALPTFVRTFQSDFATVQWVVLAFVLTQTALMLVMGRLGDMFGKKPIFIAGFALTGVGVLLCALAPNITWLLVFRVVQAIGVAMALALSMGVVAEAFPPSERGMALGMVSSVVSIGIILGPVLGGLILDTLSWRWIFLVSLPLCVIGLPVAIRYLPDVRPVKSEGRFDYAGGITFFILLFCFLLATTYGRSLGYGDWRILALLAVVVIFFLAFLFIELRTKQPVIDLRLFQHRLFSLNLTLRFVSFIVYVGILFLLPFYNENVLGLTPRISGLMLTVPSIAFGIVGIAAGILSDRFGSRFVAMAGIVLLLIGALLLSTLSATTTILGYTLRLIPLGAGLGMFQSPNNSVIFSVAPKDRIGMVSSLNSVIRTLARSASIALIGTVWASRVVVHSSGLNGDSATNAPPAAQLLAMQETFYLAAFLVFVMLLLSIWDSRTVRR